MVSEARYRLEPLNENHDVASFSCEEEYFVEYFQEQALYDMQHGFARTFLEIDADRPATNNIAGFFTLRADAVRIEDHYSDTSPISDEEPVMAIAFSLIEVPLVELMFIARDLTWKGKGLGDAMMVDALKLASEAADRIGFIGMHLRSTPMGIALYERYDFSLFQAHPHSDGMRYFLPLQNIRDIVASI